MSSDPEMVEVVQVDATVTDTYTVQKNIAANGRLFSGMIVGLNGLAFATGHGRVFALLAIAAAIPVGASVILDQMPHGTLRQRASMAVYALSAFAALAFCFNIVW